jgi:hypothetical protein
MEDPFPILLHVPPSSIALLQDVTQGEPTTFKRGKSCRLIQKKLANKRREVEILARITVAALRDALPETFVPKLS